MFFLCACILTFGFFYSIFTASKRGLTVKEATYRPPKLSQALYGGGLTLLAILVIWDLIPPKYPPSMDSSSASSEPGDNTLPLSPLVVLLILTAWSSIVDIGKGRKMGLSVIDVWRNPPPGLATRTRIITVILGIYAALYLHSSSS